MAFGLLLFLMLAVAFLLAFDDQPLYLRIALPLLGAALGTPLFVVALIAFSHRSVGGRLIPAETAPADVRAARKALHAGELSGRPEADRIARILAAQALRHQLPLWMMGVLGPLIGALNLLSARNQYGMQDGWHWLVVLALVMGAVLLAGTPVAVLLEARRRRRRRAFVAAYTARGEEDRPKGSEGP